MDSCQWHSELHSEQNIMDSCPFRAELHSEQRMAKGSTNQSCLAHAELTSHIRGVVLRKQFLSLLGRILRGLVRALV